MKRFNLMTCAAFAAVLLLSSACKQAEEAEPATEEQEAVAEALEGTAEEIAPTTDEEGDMVADPEEAEQAAGEEVEATGTASPEALAGTWELNVERTVAGVSDEEREMAMAMMGQMQMQMSFDGEGTVTMTMTAQGAEAQTREASYTTGEASGATMPLTITPADTPAEEARVTFLDDDNIQIAPPEGTPANQPPMVLSRVAAE